MSWATHSRLRPIVETAPIIRGRRDNLLSYFEHRITLEWVSPWSSFPIPGGGR